MAITGKEILGKIKVTAASAATTVGDAATNVAKSAGDKVEEGKMMTEINSKKKEISLIFAKIGEAVYQTQGDTFEKSAVGDDIAAIDAAYERIRELKLKVAEFRGMKVCPKCGKENAKDNAFCPSCGEKL